MSDAAPRVSVIVPAYNAADHIAVGLQSVVRQTFSDWEVVVCDDGSTDETAAIADTFGERVRVVRSPTNEGLASARNRALAEARGELIALLDADDYWLPEYLEDQVELFDEAQARHSRIGIVACNAYLQIDGERSSKTYSDRLGCADNVTVTTLLEHNPVFVSVLLSRAALDEVGSFAPELRSCEDLDLWLRMLEAGFGSTWNRRPLAVYSLRSGQLSAQPLAMARAQQIVYRRALERGALTRSQRRLAQRGIRLQRAVEQAAKLTDCRRKGALSPSLVVRNLPLFARVSLEHPRSWWRWVTLGRRTLRQG